MDLQTAQSSLHQAMFPCRTATQAALQMVAAPNRRAFRAVTHVVRRSRASSPFHHTTFWLLVPLWSTVMMRRARSCIRAPCATASMNSRPDLVLMSFIRRCRSSPVSIERQRRWVLVERSIFVGACRRNRARSFARNILAEAFASRLALNAQICSSRFWQHRGSGRRRRTLARTA